MIQDEFKFFKPCKLLQPYVRYYWVFNSNQLLNTFTFPIGCPQIIFHKQSPLYIPELNATQDKLTISGQVNFSSHLYADKNIEMIVVVFHPHAMSAFLNVPTSLFYNQEVSGYSLENRSLNELAARIFECEDNSFVGINPKEYTRIVRFQRALKLMQHRHAEINLAQIAYASGYADQSHCTREFKRFCGYTPASLLKMTTPYSDLFTNPL